MNFKKNQNQISVLWYQISVNYQKKKLEQLLIYIHWNAIFQRLVISQSQIPKNQFKNWD